jgi:hypothetical protein
MHYIVWLAAIRKTSWNGARNPAFHQPGAAMFHVKHSPLATKRKDQSTAVKNLLRLATWTNFG